MTFAKALCAECAGKGFYAGCNFPLHLSSFFYDFDVYGHGRPTAGLNLPPGTDLRALTGELPVSAHINSMVMGEPWFKHFEPEYIDRYIEAVHKVAEYHTELLDSNEVQEFQGGMALTHRKTK